MPQVARPSAPIYDVVIIGSGAGGGTVTQVLTQMGIALLLSVLVCSCFHEQPDFINTCFRAARVCKRSPLI
jgi:hypothetical protein